MIEELTVPGVSRIPVAISGKWSEPPKRDWRGVASATEPLVAVIFLRWQHHVEWVLSGRSVDTAIETRLAIFPYDKIGLDVQVNVSIGGGGSRYRSLLPSPIYRPIIPAVATVETGTVTLLARIEGDPVIDFLGLFITKGDTTGVRNHIWHLRSCFHSTIPPQLAETLTYGRTGSFEETL